MIRTVVDVRGEMLTPWGRDRAEMATWIVSSFLTMLSAVIFIVMHLGVPDFEPAGNDSFSDAGL